MDDERQPALLREPDVAVEIVLLLVERREIPVAIEAGFANRDDARLRRPIATTRSQSPGCALGDVIRLHADGRINSVDIPHASRTQIALVGSRRADRDHFCHAGIAGPGDDFRAIGVELGLVQMRVGVEELNHNQRSER